jgi:tripartite-type tricarboxylate transporter receptor subunit TctC
MKLPEIQERLRAFGAQPADSDPAKFAAFLKAEAQTWGDVVRATGLKAQ